MTKLNHSWFVCLIGILGPNWRVRGCLPLGTELASCDVLKQFLGNCLNSQSSLGTCNGVHELVTETLSKPPAC